MVHILEQVFSLFQRQSQMDIFLIASIILVVIGSGRLYAAKYFGSKVLSAIEALAAVLVLISYFVK